MICINGLLQLFVFVCGLHGFAIWAAQIGIWDGVVSVLYAGPLGDIFNFMVCVILRSM